MPTAQSVSLRFRAARQRQLIRCLAGRGARSPTVQKISVSLPTPSPTLITSSIPHGAVSQFFDFDLTGSREAVHALVVLSAQDRTPFGRIQRSETAEADDVIDTVPGAAPCRSLSPYCWQGCLLNGRSPRPPFAFASWARTYLGAAPVKSKRRSAAPVLFALASTATPHPQ